MLPQEAIKNLLPTQRCDCGGANLCRVWRKLIVDELVIQPPVNGGMFLPQGKHDFMESGADCFLASARQMDECNVARIEAIERQLEHSLCFPAVWARVVADDHDTL